MAPTLWRRATDVELRTSLEWLARARRGQVVHRATLELDKVVTSCGLWLRQADVVVWPIHELLPIWPAPRCIRCWHSGVAQGGR